jgi:hypothetical protein
MGSGFVAGPGNGSDPRSIALPEPCGGIADAAALLSTTVRKSPCWPAASYVDKSIFLVRVGM